jgi:F0F1-type ATP synthase assembly protein I
MRDRLTVDNLLAGCLVVFVVCLFSTSPIAAYVGGSAFWLGLVLLIVVVVRAAGNRTRRR